MQWGWFLYSQTDNYKDKSAFIWTVNYKDDQTMHDVVPFEYYNSLIKEEIFEQKTLKHKYDFYSQFTFQIFLFNLNNSDLIFIDFAVRLLASERSLLTI